MAVGKGISDEVWETARVIWEQTPKISYGELLEQLQELFGDKAPKSKSSISNRKKKENWAKASSVKKNSKMTATRANKMMQNAEQKQPRTKNSEQKNNKAQNSEQNTVYRTLTDEIENAKENVIMSTEQRAAIIIKHRRRLKHAGMLEDAIIKLSLEAADDIFNPKPEPEPKPEVKSDDIGDDFKFTDEDGGEKDDPILTKIHLAKELSIVLTNVTQSQKVIAEQEMPMCGITPDDFQQSEQERRLGALEALAGIHEEEERAREIKRRELQERMAVIAQLENDPDFFNSGDDDIEDAEIDEDY